MLEDYIVLGEWEGQVSGNKTNVKPKEYKSKDYLKHSCKKIRNPDFS